MNQTKQEIFQLLLNLHKQLLEEQKKEYEKTYGVIATTNQYFQLVVSHEDFEWLRQLSVLISSFDEALESDNQDVTGVTKELLLLLSGSGDEKFYRHLQLSTHQELINQVIDLLKNLA
jgi:hypothetical protein